MRRRELQFPRHAIPSVHPSATGSGPPVAVVGIARQGLVAARRGGGHDAAEGRPVEIPVVDGAAHECGPAIHAVARVVRGAVVDAGGVHVESVVVGVGVVAHVVFVDVGEGARGDRSGVHGVVGMCLGIAGGFDPENVRGDVAFVERTAGEDHVLGSGKTLDGARLIDEAVDGAAGADAGIEGRVQVVVVGRLGQHGGVEVDVQTHGRFVPVVRPGDAGFLFGRLGRVREDARAVAVVADTVAGAQGVLPHEGGRCLVERYRIVDVALVPEGTVYRTLVVTGDQVDVALLHGGARDAAAAVPVGAVVLRVADPDVVVQLAPVAGVGHDRGGRGGVVLDGGHGGIVLVVVVAGELDARVPGGAVVLAGQYEDVALRGRAGRRVVVKRDVHVVAAVLDVRAGVGRVVELARVAAIAADDFRRFPALAPVEGPCVQEHPVVDRHRIVDEVDVPAGIFGMIGDDPGIRQPGHVVVDQAEVPVPGVQILAEHVDVRFVRALESHEQPVLTALGNGQRGIGQPHAGSADEPVELLPVLAAVPGYVNHDGGLVGFYVHLEGGVEVPVVIRRQGGFLFEIIAAGKQELVG